MLHLTFVYYPEDDDQPVVITEADSPVVPRIGDTVMIDEDDATQKGMPNAWEVIDVFYQLPKIGAVSAITSVTVYIDPSEDEDEDEE
jgi:hypothetical protein